MTEQNSNKGNLPPEQTEPIEITSEAIPANAEQQSDSPKPQLEAESKPEPASALAPEPEPAPKKTSGMLIIIKDKLVEKSPQIVLVPRKKIKKSSRRDFLIYGAGMVALASGYKWLLPDDSNLDKGFGLYKKNFLAGVNNFDDAVAKALFSQNTLVPTYSKSQMTELPNNYAGQTPDGAYLPDWKLKISGLASGHDVILNADKLRNDFAHQEIISRMVCVEGWSAISWWGGLRFADLLKKYPPKADTKWIKLTSDVNLDGDGNSDPYFVSIDLPSALHHQTLLATHQNGKLLEIEHGAPLRLLAPMKLGLKNIKAITSIAYSASEPDDYWAKEGYSYYDGI